MNFLWPLEFLSILIGILLAVAFFTLLERKILGYIHIRKGPNKISLMGIFQPFSDALKLFSKENSKLMSVNFFMMAVSPSLGLFITLILWSLYPSKMQPLWFELSLIFMFSVMSISIYFLLGCGWSTNSKFALLGSYRAVAQTISYEVAMILILLTLIILVFYYNLNKFNFMQNNYWFLIFMPLLSFLWLISCLAETNRSPFDFSESESELVSGFNTEYSGGMFSLIFISEYGNILFLSLITVLIWSSNKYYLIKCFLLGTLFIWIRGSFPRLRYDKLMALAWKTFLPVSLAIFTLLIPSMNY